MPLQVYNTLTRRKEIFEPLHPPRVGMYVCGPTVYGHAHLGHAKSYVHFDVINRWLRYGPHIKNTETPSSVLRPPSSPLYRGYDVQYVQNITDVGHLTDDADEGEDKIIAEARRRGLHPMAVADFFTRSYEEDMRALNVLPPDIAPRASGHIPEQIAMIQLLVNNKHAYVVNGSVYFSVESFPGYGKLSGRKLEEQEAGARVAVNSEKRHPADFALWKRAEPGHLMQWDSPWGKGYPGWHIECSAMSTKYLGDSFDIHGGGMENQFPHHECEICQAEGATGRPFVKYWLHNNMVTINGQKMGKSLNNYVRLKELFSGQIEDADRATNVKLSQAYDPMVVRFLILQSHYRSTLDFSDESLRAAKAGYDKLVAVVRRLEQEGDQNGQVTVAPELQTKLDQLRQRFTDAMNDDFNSAAALAALFEAASLANTLLATPNSCPSQVLRKLFGDLGGHKLGLQFAALGSLSSIHNPTQDAADRVMQVLIALRSEARKNKDFKTSDTIRDKLKAVGIELLDGKDGTRWKIASS